MNKRKWMVLTVSAAALGAFGVRIYRKRLASDNEPDEDILEEGDEFADVYQQAEMPAPISAQD